MPKRYFWLKLKEDFFNGDDIKVIISQENGSDYVIFWMKLLLKAISGAVVGLLRYKENIPYTPEILSTVTDTNIDIVKGALTLFQKLGMVEILENGDLWINNANELVGSETDSANRMRRLRERKVDLIVAKASQSDNEVTRCYVDIEKEKEIEKKKIYTQLLSCGLFPDNYRFLKKDIENTIINEKKSERNIREVIQYILRMKKYRELPPDEILRIINAALIENWENLSEDEIAQYFRKEAYP